MKSIILTGIKHCGKSTQGRLLSQELNLPLFDTDDVITEMTGMTPREIYVSKGEEGFKTAEFNACVHIEKVLDGKNGVIATGGGICNNPLACEVLKRLGAFVFLMSDEKTAFSRIAKEMSVNEDGTISGAPAYIAKKNPRSIEEAGNYFHEFYEERIKLYNALADKVVLLNADTKIANAKRIINILGF